MVKYIADRTGRFKFRPYYSEGELDRECEQIITRHLQDRRGEVKFPVTTEDLNVLIERDAEDLDSYADLSADGPTVEGVTEFRRGRKPSVKISRDLSTDHRRENRLRTTLAHEYGHVRFHNPLFQQVDDTSDLYQKPKAVERVVCKRDFMLNPPDSDWLEWQASYISSSLLMPVSHLKRAVGAFLERGGLFGPLQSTSPEGLALCKEIMSAFQVSEDAARIRLSKLQLISVSQTQPSLFS